MDLITILEENKKKQHRKNWYSYLLSQQMMLEHNFQWLKVSINPKKKALEGNGTIIISGKSYQINILYSPFFPFRYDRVFINNQKIEYNDDIHLYGDLSLCLYHPVKDVPILQNIPLYKIIPWISEWIVFYEQWKIYGVWLGKEIKHRRIPN